MVRVAGVKAQVNSNYRVKTISTSPPRSFSPFWRKKPTNSWNASTPACTGPSARPWQSQGLRFLRCQDMTPEQLDYISQYFRQILFPVLTPLAVDGSRPFPMLANKTLNIAVYLKSKERKEEKNFAIVQVPSILPRFLELPSQEGRAFTLLEDIIIYKLDELFELHEIKAACPFRITGTPTWRSTRRPRTS